MDSQATLAPVRNKVELVKGEEPRLSAETHSLLVERLRALSLILAVALGLSWVRAFLIDLSFLYLHLFVVVGSVGAWFVLYRRIDFPRWQIRTVELALLWLPSILFAARNYAELVSAIESGEGSQLDPVMLRLSISFFALMVIYGLFVPNHWRRTALTLLPLAVAPLMIQFSVLIRYPSVEEIASSFGGFDQLSEVALISLVGAAVGVYGTRTINVLRQEAFEARKYGQYQLIEKIGHGGMGEVWKAQHALLVRPAAIKLILPRMLDSDSGKSSQLIQRFEREAKVTSLLQSPHTVSLYDFGILEDGTFYYVMEMLDGLDLATLVERFGPLSPERTVYLLKQVCESLAEAHQSHLVHRDIKPANIHSCRFAGKHDFIKVLDFGLVKQLAGSDETQLTEIGSATGTPAFMPPEIALGHDVDGRADLYSLGCVAYWLLTGEIVFEGKTAFDVVTKHVSSPPVAPSKRTGVSIPESLERSILSCLEKKPEDRPGGAKELLRQLSKCKLESEWNESEAKDWWEARGL